MKKIILFLAFLSFGCLFADDPNYLYCEDWISGREAFVTYFYGDLNDGLSSLFPGVALNVMGDGYFASDDYSFAAVVFTPQQYYDEMEYDTPYLPFSDDPAYASSVPSGPPSGGGSSGGGGGYSGGSGGSFDASSSLGGMGDLASGLALGVGSLVLAGVGIVSGLLVYRKFVVSAKRV